MNKTIYRIMSVMLALALAMDIFISGQAKSKPTTLMSGGTINLAFFYKPPANSEAGTVARNFHVLILTGGDESFRDQLATNGFSSTIPQYFGSVGIQDPGNCTSTPRKNQVAYKAGDFCSISKNHPDWFLLDARGQRIPDYPGHDIYRMDPGNPGWRNFFVTRVLESQEKSGWSGLFLDNLEASLDEMQQAGITTTKYPDDASYQAAILGFLQYLRANYSQPYRRPVLANIIARKDEATWFSYLQYLDGAMQERWAVGWSVDKYVTETKWKSDMALAEKTQSQGKHILLIAPGNKTDTGRQKFAFASYLLISNGTAAFRYSNEESYSQVWLYDNYNVNLGTPRGARYQSGSLWRRDFTNGYVTVDPVNHTATISTGSSGEQEYDDNNSLFVYSSGWQVTNSDKAYNGSYHETTQDGASLTFPFTGQSFSILYKGNVTFNKVQVYVDGTLVGTIDEYAPTSTYGMRWNSPAQFTLGKHTLKLVFKPTGTTTSRASLDAVIVR